MSIRKKSLAVATSFIALAGLGFSSASLAGWCGDHLHHCREHKSVTYKGCRRIVHERVCGDHHGFRYCRVEKKVRYVC